jgi:hypothetical protein
MATKILLRRGTSEAWSIANPVLSYGEVGIEIDQNRFRIGDGSTAFNELPVYQDSSSFLGDVPEEFDNLGKIAAALVISGGTEGQALAKSSGEDYDLEWVDLEFRLSDLLDIDLTGLANNTMLVYNLATQSWRIRPAGVTVYASASPPAGAVDGDIWVW